MTAVIDGTPTVPPLAAGLGARVLAALLTACADYGGEADSTRSRRAELSPAPACDDGDEATPQQTEGTLFTPETLGAATW